MNYDAAKKRSFRQIQLTRSIRIRHEVSRIEPLQTSEFSNEIGFEQYSTIA